MVSWGARHELEVVWLVFVVASNIEHHHSLEEYLGSRVVAERGIMADIEKLAGGWVVARLRDDSSIQA